MTSGEPTTETEELSASLLGIISAYRMGAALDARDLYQKTAPEASPPPTGVPAEGYVRDDVYHVPGNERRTVRA